MIKAVWILILISPAIDGFTYKVDGRTFTFSGGTFSEGEELVHDKIYDPPYVEVKFENSNLFSVPSEIFNYFRNVEKLDLKYQKVKEIRNNTFENATKLEILDLQHNLLQNLRKNSFLGMRDLKTLYLDYNFLSELSEGTFDGLENLKVLYIAFNELENFSSKIFYPLENLEEIFLYSNKIQLLPGNLFKMNHKLKWIDFENNKIYGIPTVKIFRHLENLAGLSMSSNLCVNENWWPDAHLKIDEIEGKLTNCSLNYRHLEMQNFGAINGKLSEILLKVDANAQKILKVEENLKTSNLVKTNFHPIDNLERILQNLEEIFDQKLEKLVQRLEVNFEIQIKKLEANLERKLASRIVSNYETCKDHDVKIVVESVALDADNVGNL